ncbi:hypothetical protein Rumeso_00264 [Rubellimicrobium mesophilum DSM 19309]|uniref:Probable membrane transporter protein n=1 Tax=Rubellimicrobium mesophilum DSM 19309 TaxID=442562 RepID=A0A017HUW0_9RHOB|nr:sulfite exporter TauE/SafE family protein [Rubellimicrobium mesophilum]EYD78171.1 hypothetical protein Rumeso_00264 [Rubellimicrobium mesophilum DSM 19309]
MPLDLGPLAWGWLAVVALGASFVRGYSGFGFAALLIAGASLVTPPVALVPSVILCDIALTAPQWVTIRGAIDWRRVAFLFGGCLIGVPLGVRAVAEMGEDTARIVVALYVLAMCLVLLRGWRLARPAGGAANGVLGVVSGLANGAAVGGLPVAAFFAAQPIPPATFRATLVAYFAVLDLYTLAVLGAGGLVSRHSLALAALGLPVMLAGLHLGSRHFLKAPPEEFRRFAIWTLMALALLGLLRAAL